MQSREEARVFLMADAWPESVRLCDYHIVQAGEQSRLWRPARLAHVSCEFRLILSLRPD